MVWFYIFGTLLILFFLLRNVISEQNYRKHKETAFMVFDDTRRSHKVYRICFFIGFLLMIAVLVVTLFVLRLYDFNTIMAEICLLAFCALSSFVPYTQGKWTLSEEGVFLYNYNLFIKWSEMASAKPLASGKKSYLMIYLLGNEGNKLKKNYYPVMLPGPQVQEMQNMFREFISLEDKRRQKLRIEAQKASRGNRY